MGVREKEKMRRESDGFTSLRKGTGLRPDQGEGGSDEPLARSRKPSPALITSFLRERGCHPFPPHTEPALGAGLGLPAPSGPSRPPFSSPPWDAVLGTGDLAGSCLYFWL